MMFWLARRIDRLTRARDHIWTWHPSPCAGCKRRTWWVEINFEAPLHRGKCTRIMDADYFAAAARPPSEADRPWAEWFYGHPMASWDEGRGGACPDCKALEGMPCKPGCQHCF